MPHLRRLVALPVLTLLTGVLTVSLAGPASAAPIAYNTKTQYLTSAPVDSPTMPTSCVQRRISLAAATYEWGGYYGTYQRVRSIYLGSGAYTWKDCLDPKNGYYLHTSSLDPDNPAWDTASWSRNVPPPPVSGTYQWGSYLDPPF